MNINEIQGRYTIVGFNSIGFPIAWDTNIKSIEECNGSITVIHKPKGKKQYFKHEFDKLNHTRIYKGWLNENTMDIDFVSFDESCLSMFDKYDNKKVLELN